MKWTSRSNKIGYIIEDNGFIHYLGSNGNRDQIYNIYNRMKDLLITLLIVAV